VIARGPGGLEVRDLDLLAPGRASAPLTFPDEAGPAERQARLAPLAQVFLAFSRFPAAESIRHRNGDVTVHWYDIRFAEAVPPGADGRSRISPFAVWVRLSPAGKILAQGLGPG